MAAGTIGGTSLPVDVNGNPIGQTAPSSTTINNGYATVTTSGTTTLVTVPAGKTWIGTVGASITCALAGAVTTGGSSAARINTAGTGVTPAAGSVCGCLASAGSNVAGGTVGTQGANSVAGQPLVVIAPAGNSVTITLVASVAASLPTTIDGWAIGVNQ